MEIESTILGLNVFTRSKRQYVVLIVDNNTPIKMPSFLLKKASGLQAHEFEMLIGQRVSCSYYMPGDVINELGETCEYTNSVLKGLSINYTTTFEHFYLENNKRKFPFEKINRVNVSKRNRFIVLFTNENKYEVDVKVCSLNFTWEYFLLEDSYLLSIDPKREQYINENLLLRLHSDFFKKIKNANKEHIKNLTYSYLVAVNPPTSSNEGKRYTREDYINDAFGGQEDASWNID